MKTTTTPGYTLWQLVLYMLRLGTFGFGGPVALVGNMHRDPIIVIAAALVGLLVYPLIHSHAD